MALAFAHDTQALLTQSGTAEFIDLNALHVDHKTYQPLARHRLSRLRPMALDWEPRIVGALLVSLRADGTLWVVDGATRHGAAMLRNEMVRSGEHPNWPVILGVHCVIHSGLTLAEEARMFEVMNGPGRLAVHVVDRYHAGLLYREPTAMAIQTALDRHGLKVAYTPTSDAISAVGVLEHLLAWGVLEATLAIIQDAWPQIPVAHHTTPLLAVGAFELRYRDLGYSRSDLAALLLDQDPRALIQDARDGVADPASWEGKAVWAAMAALMRDDYSASTGQELPRFVQPPRPRAGQRLSKPVENRSRRPA
jgi:hypothetical protein